ncbi:MAG: helix-turn-helix domain-containing protein [Terrisporobacter sp.]|uniref:helix-turn-helix domain-containing protein n=1 Tax=Terrisporobacter sp. TaxID=1965305 RepID=UPI002FCC7AD9
MNDVDISKNICEYRKSKGLSIKELANLTGVTSSLLSQIEKGSANPSINTIKQISKALDVPLFNFFINDNPTENLVVRKDGRKKMTFSDDDSFAYELLTPNLQGAIEFVLMKIPPKESSSKELFCHKGEEVAYIMKGNVSLYIMNTVVVLNSGDSVKIPPQSNHKWENHGVEECEVIFALTPPSF